MRFFFNVILMTLAVSLISSCFLDVSVTRSDVKFKEYEKHADKSVLYIYRVYDFLASAVVRSVYLDDNCVANLNIDGYYVTELSPGNHKVRTENIGPLYKQININCSSNDEIYLRLDPEIHIVSKKIAEKELKNMYYENTGSANNEILLTPKYQYKNIITAMLLGGGIGLAGVFIPGTYGWGNFYAEDYTGFWILNIGGSLCTIGLWADVIRASASNSEVSGLGYAGLLGWGVFCIASEVWGGLAADSYNQKVLPKEMSVSVSPANNGIYCNMAYRF